jgi:exoribonuclease II
LKALKAARKEKYDGWEFSALSRHALKDEEEIEQKKFPFRLDELLPWWRRLNEIKGAKAAAAAP